MRWHAVVYYRTEAGLVEVEHDYDEIVDLHNFIENGPHWGCIDRIEIRYQGHPPLTLAKAKAL